ncbi:MAG: PQQ-binding-like beta-propeller repeat protein, partial [Methanobacterium sp.]|nr:PQQ-binding-like beta-propeller repeat protein [Methanobacterium sp.]
MKKYNKLALFVMIIGMIICISAMGAVSAEESPVNVTNNTASETSGTGGFADTTSGVKSSGDISNTGLSNYTGPEVNTTLWNYTTGGSIESQVSPVIGSDGTIYIGSTDGKLYALNPDGSVKWTYTTGDKACGIAIGSDGTIYVSGGYDNSLHALNPDGTLKWKYKTRGNILGTPTVGFDGTIYVGSCDSNLYALNPDGTLKWNYTTENLIYGLGGGPAIGSDGTIYVECGGDFGKLYALNPDGTLQWYYTIGGNLDGSPTISADGAIYVGGTNGAFYALNPDGTLKWKYSNGGSSYEYDTMIHSSSIGPDRTIYFGCNNGYLYALNINGTQKWNYSIGKRISGSPLIGSDGTIYVGSYDGKMYAFSSNGTLLWTYTTGGIIYGSAAIGANETLYFGSSDKNVYAIANTVCRANQTNGGAPLTVQFNASDVSPDSWSWDFGDGNSSTEQNPIHTYVNPGFYNVTLTVTRSNGQTRTVKFPQYIKAYYSPVSNFTASTPWGSVPSVDAAVYNQIQFKDTSTNVPTSWYWDFGDGTYSTGQNPTHAYTNTGTYTVKLTVTNPGGSTSYSNVIRVRGTISANSTLTDGTYNTTQSVNLTSSNSAATIYYTNDTTDPRTSSTRVKYTGPINIIKTTTLRYAAVTSTGKWSPLYVQNYVIGTGGLINSSNPTYQGDNNNTGQSEYTGPQTNTTKWNNSEIISIQDTCVVIGLDGTIYSGSGNGYLYALYPTGVIKWFYYSGSSLQVTTPSIGKDGTIYILAAGYLQAIETDGTLKWKVQVYSTNLVSPTVGTDGTIYITSYDNSGFLDTALYAINPDGTVKWNTTIADAGTIYGNLAIGSDGTIYVPGTNFYAVNPDGTIKWSYAFVDHQYSSPSIGPDGTIYILGYSGTYKGKVAALYAFNPDGTVKWTYKTKTANYGTAAIGSDGTIYLLDAGNLIAINPDGTQKWNCSVKSSLCSPVIAANGIIYCGLTAVNPDGTILLNYTGVTSNGNPTIDSDGTMYIGTSNGLYAFRDVAAKFSYTTGLNPLVAQFNDTSTSATSWIWNFGDGTNST